MNIKIGDRLGHGGEEFVIVDIRHDEHIEGKSLMIRALDPAMANEEQEKQIKMEQTGKNMIDLLRKLTEGGGFNIGGIQL